MISMLYSRSIAPGSIRGWHCHCSVLHLGIYKLKSLNLICVSIKYPYLLHGRFFLFEASHPPLNFQFNSILSHKNFGCWDFCPPPLSEFPMTFHGVCNCMDTFWNHTMLGETLWLTSIYGEGGRGVEILLVAFCKRNWDIVGPDGPLGSNADLNHLSQEVQL